MIFQAEDRAHRITQKECVNCYYLYGENTLDDLLYQKLERKFEVVSSILEGNRKGTLNLQEGKEELRHFGSSQNLGIERKDRDEYNNSFKNQTNFSSDKKDGLQKKLYDFFTNPKEKEGQSIDRGVACGQEEKYSSENEKKEKLYNDEDNDDIEEDQTFGDLVDNLLNLKKLQTEPAHNLNSSNMDEKDPYSEDDLDKIDEYLSEARESERKAVGELKASGDEISFERSSIHARNVEAVPRIQNEFSEALQQLSAINAGGKITMGNGQDKSQSSLKKKVHESDSVIVRPNAVESLDPGIVEQKSGFHIKENKENFHLSRDSEAFPKEKAAESLKRENLDQFLIPDVPEPSRKDQSSNMPLNGGGTMNKPHAGGRLGKTELFRILKEKVNKKVLSKPQSIEVITVLSDDEDPIDCTIHDNQEKKLTTQTKESDMVMKFKRFNEKRNNNNENERPSFATKRKLSQDSVEMLMQFKGENKLEKKLKDISLEEEFK